jgi:hypothetical protein
LSWLFRPKIAIAAKEGVSNSTKNVNENSTKLHPDIKQFSLLKKINVLLFSLPHQMPHDITQEDIKNHKAMNIHRKTKQRLVRDLISSS